MLEKPDLSDDVILAVLRDDYGVRAAALKFLLIGNDSLSWVYRVEAEDGAAYFLKARGGDPYPPSLLVPRTLRDMDIGHVVAPLPTTTRALSVPAEGFSLILYPFIEGISAWDADLTEAQWVELGATLRRIHRAVLPPALVEQVYRDTFVSPANATIRDVQAAIERGGLDDIAVGAAAFWNEHHDDIHGLAAALVTLGQQLAAAPPPFVLCHTDIHTANILIDPDGRLHIVDWDTPMYSPRERDLMFVDWRDGSEAFYRGYGQVEIDRLAMAYLKIERAAADIGDFAERVFLTTGLGDETRRDAVNWLTRMFAPGDMVDLARQAVTLL